MRATESRVAGSKAPRNSESQAISYAVKYIRRACPSVAWIQSFADERCGGWGVVYQAANFEYLGHHMTSFYELDGETYHEMLITAHKKSGQRGEYLRQNLHRAVHRRLMQFRYIYFVRQAWRKRLKYEPLPYPKPGKPLPDRRKLKGQLGPSSRPGNGGPLSLQLSAKSRAN